MQKKHFFIIKILLTVISFISAIIAKSNIDWNNFQNNYVDPVLVKEIVYDLSVGIFSAMVLIWFIDEINNHLQERSSQKKEIDAIRRFDKVLQQYIEKYVVSFYCVVTPLLERKFENVYMPENFTLKDMRDLYETSLLLKEKSSCGSVETFLQIELDLRNELISLVKKYDFDFFPKFTDIFLEFIQASLAHDSRSFILDVPGKPFGEEMYTDFIHRILENDADEYYQKILNGEGAGSNIMYSYVLLYEMMKKERKLILQYQDEIKKLY